MIAHRAFFGDAEHSFCLTDPMIAELERLADTGIGVVFNRLMSNTFHHADLHQIIRLGLIGGGMNPEQALRLVETYGKDRPITEVLPLALDIISARWLGVEADQ